MFDLCAECGNEILGYLDKVDQGSNFIYKYLGNDESIAAVIRQFPEAGFVISPDNPAIRETLANLYLIKQVHFPSIISLQSKVSKSAIIGSGTIIQYGVFVSANVRIGSFVKLNVYSNLMHDVQIGDYTTIAPNAAIMGRVSIGNRCYIGANSTIKQELQICDDVIIGAGAVVTKDITETGTYIGVPAKGPAW